MDTTTDLPPESCSWASTAALLLDRIKLELRCPICRELVGNGACGPAQCTPCGHTFCKDCISAHMAANVRGRGSRCPTCKATLERRALREATHESRLAAAFLNLREAALGVGHEKLGDEARAAMAEICCRTQMQSDEVAASGGGEGAEEVWMGGLPRPPPPLATDEQLPRKASKRKRVLGAPLGELHERVEAGDLEGAVKILRDGWDSRWDAAGDAETLPLLIIKAVESGSVQILSAMIQAGANPDATDSFGQTGLYCAARDGLAAACKTLLAARAKCSIPNDQGSFPLHMAAEGSRPAIVQMLIAAKAEVDVRDGDGDTALHLAAHAKGRTHSSDDGDRRADVVATVELLLEARADPSLSRPVAPRLAWMLCKDKTLKVKLREAAEAHAKERPEPLTPAAQRATRRNSPSGGASLRNRSEQPSISPTAGKATTATTVIPAQVVDPPVVSSSAGGHRTTSSNNGAVDEVLHAATNNDHRPATVSNNRSLSFLFHHQNSADHAEVLQRCQEIVERLGGVVVADFENDTELTHLVTFGLRRSEKVVCAVAKGCFIVSPDYLEMCDAASTFVENEENFPPDSSDKTSSAIWPGAASRWRDKWQTEGEGPFSGLRVLINGETKPNLKALSRMISAGGGTVEVEHRSGLKVDLAVLGPQEVKEHQQLAPATRHNVNQTWLQWVERHGVQVVSAKYFVEFITNERLPGVEEWRVCLG